MSLWRHLAGAGEDERVLEVGFPDREAHDGAPTDGFDHAVVLLETAEDSALADVLARLRPDGQVVMALPLRTGRRTPLAGARATLERHGLIVIATVWVGPSWPQPTWAVPVRAGLDRWFVRDWYVPWSNGELLALAVTRPAPRLSTRSVAAGVALVGRRGFGGAAPLDRLVADLRETPELRDRVPDPAQAVLMAGGTDSRRLAAFLFGPDSSSPDLFVKVAGQEDAQRLEREQSNLALVAAIPELAGSVPVPLALLDRGSTRVAVHSGVPGSSMAGRLRRHRTLRAVDADLELALEWLGRLQTSTTRGTTELLPDLADRVRAALPDELAGRLNDRLAPELDRAGRRTVPLVRAHGDFWAGNLLLDDTDVRVVDWEHSRDGATPWQDLFMLLTTAPESVSRFAARGRRVGPRFAAAWLDPGRVGELCRGRARRFLAAHGLEDVALQPLLVDFLLRMVDDPPFGDGATWRRCLEVLAESGGTP